MVKGYPKFDPDSWKLKVPFLPLDIFEKIIDILINENENENDGLQHAKKLTRICRSFLPFCRKYLFSSIYIRNPSSPLKPKLDNQAFEHLLSKSPDIANYIRQLKIDVEFPQSESLHVPQHLPNLQSLTVSGSFQTFYFKPMDWNDVLPSMQCSLLDLMHLPTLIRLDLSRIENFPISNLITLGPNLKHLSADQLYITTDSDDHETATEFPQSSLYKPMQLESFDLSIRSLGEQRALLPNWQLIHFSRLEKVCIGFDHDTDAAIVVQEMIRRSQQLTDISLTVHETGLRAIQFAQIVTPSLQTLGRVHLTTYIEGASEDPLAGLCHELQQISGKNKLESLKIEIGVRMDDECRTGDEWGRLEEVLLLKSGWPMLKHVSLNIVVYNFRREENSPFALALKGLQQTQFTRLTSTEHLNFQFLVREEQTS